MKVCASLILLLGLCATALAQTTAPADPELENTLAALDAKAATITDLSAKFEQQKVTPLLKKPLTSSGVVRAKGAVMLWETARPEPTVMRIDDKSLQLLYVGANVLEVYPIDSRLGAMASNPVPRLATLGEQFTIEKQSQSAETLTLRLLPRDEKLRQYVIEVVVEIDPQQGVARKFTMTDPDGEQTVIRFSDYALNPGLTDAQLTISVPAGTKTVHPLDSAR